MRKIKEVLRLKFEVGLCAEAGTRAAAPFPTTIPPPVALSSLHSDGVRVHPGMPFELPFGIGVRVHRNPHVLGQSGHLAL